MSYSGTISNTTVFHTALDVIKNMVLESSVSNITVVKDVEFIYPPYPPPHVPPNPPLLPSPPFPPPDMPSPPTPPSNPYIASPYSPEPSPPPPPEPSAPEPSPPPPPEPRTPEPSPPPPSPQSPPPPDLSPSPPFPPPGPPEPPPSPPSLPFPPSPPPAPPSSPPIPLIPPKPPASPPLPPLKPPPPPSPPPPQSPNPPPRPPKPPSPPPSPPSPPSEPPSPPSPPSPPASPPFPPFSPPPPPCPPRPPPYPFLPIYIRPTGCEGQEYCKNYCCNLADEDCSGQTCVVQSKDFCYNEINSLPSQFKGFRSNYDPQKPFYPAYSQIATQSQITETHRQKKNKDYCDVNKSPCICVIDFQYACNSTFMRLGISLDSSYVQVLHSKNFAYTTGASFTCEYDPPKPPSSPFPPFPPPVPPIPPLLPPDPPSKPPPPFVPPPPSLPPSPPPDAPPPNPYPPPPPRPPPPSPPPPQPPPSPPPYPPPPPGRPPFPPVIIYGDFVENTSRTYVQADLVCKINDNYPLYADLYDAINECNKVHNCKGVYSYNCLDFNYTICTDEGYASETNPLCSDTTIKNIKYNKRFKFKIPTVDAGQTIYQVIAGAIGGLDENLNPDPVRQSFIVDAKFSLQKYGIDVFSSMDGVYYKGSALSHDKHVIRDAIEIINENEDESIFLFVNLLGCRDIVRKRFYNPNTKVSDYVHNNWEKNTNVDNERLIPQSVRFLGNTKLDTFIRRCKLSKDKIYGEDCVDDYLHPKEKFNALQTSTWNDMIILNKYLHSLHNAIYEKYENFVSGIVSTNSVSLEEHCVRVSAPVEACCRSFWCLSDNKSDREVETNDDPYCVNNFWNFLYKRINIDNKINFNIPVTTCTLDFSSVNCDNYSMRFIVNLKGRIYTVVSLWSLKDIAYESNISENISDNDIVNICSKKNCLPIPDVKVACIFSLIEDPDELDDIKEKISSDLFDELSTHCYG